MSIMDQIDKVIYTRRVKVNHNHFRPGMTPEYPDRRPTQMMVKISSQKVGGKWRRVYANDVNATYYINYHGQQCSVNFEELHGRITNEK